MRFSERWLRTMVDPPVGTAELCEKLTMAGLEVEDATPVAPPFSGVVVGRIERIEPHPNADRLRVCLVDIGAPERLKVVCGAPNAAVGMKAPCATIGARLPGGLAITRATMRGVESQGMLCSAKELGIDDDASGLLALPPDAPIGADVRVALDLDDTRITLKLTPNRADCLSVFGVAREVAALTEATLVPPLDALAPVTGGAMRPVSIEDREACPRFVSRTIEGIDARAPTPAWMKQRLERSGIRAISAVVDITNYVMLELGQPLHAYDERQLDRRIVVRFARPGETLTLLNGQVLELEADLLLVADATKPLGLAGIMGGEHSGINDTTTAVFLEGAFWSPAVIQGKSRRLGFTSDAGYRFERGVDFGACRRAVERATQLIIDVCGGLAGPVGDEQGVLPRRDPVRLRPGRVARLLGISVADAEIASVFQRLGLAFERAGDDFLVTPPSHRFDIAIEEDLVEEIARLHGFDGIPAVASAHLQSMLAAPETSIPTIAIKKLLVARGWQEVITFSFVSSASEATLAPPHAGRPAPLVVLNPIASNLDVMRTTLAGGLIEVLRTNLARRQDRVRIFEAGRCFARAGQGYDQPLRLGGLAYGDALPEQWGASKRPVDFFDVKRDLEALVAPRKLVTERTDHPALHPGRAASVLLDGVPVGWVGELHPRVAKEFELPVAPILFELDLAPLTARALPTASPVSKIPVVRRDIALVLDDGLPSEELLAALHAGKPARVDEIRLFDVYRGPGIGPGKKSLAILVLIQDTERTLTDAEIDANVAQLLQIALDRFGATLRQ